MPSLLTPDIPIDRGLALAHGMPLPDDTQGIARFADISSFTPLAESLVGGRASTWRDVLRANDVPAPKHSARCAGRYWRSLPL
jgi:hypothetical protein